MRLKRRKMFCGWLRAAKLHSPSREVRRWAARGLRRLLQRNVFLSPQSAAGVGRHQHPPFLTWNLNLARPAPRPRARAPPRHAPAPARALLNCAYLHRAVSWSPLLACPHTLAAGLLAGRSSLSSQGQLGLIVHVSGRRSIALTMGPCGTAAYTSGAKGNIEEWRLINMRYVSATSQNEFYIDGLSIATYDLFVCLIMPKQIPSSNQALKNHCNQRIKLFFLLTHFEKNKL